MQNKNLGFIGFWMALLTATPVLAVYWFIEYGSNLINRNYVELFGCCFLVSCLLATLFMGTIIVELCTGHRQSLKLRLLEVFIGLLASFLPVLVACWFIQQGRHLVNKHNEEPFSFGIMFSTAILMLFLSGALAALVSKDNNQDEWAAED